MNLMSFFLELLITFYKRLYEEREIGPEEKGEEPRSEGQKMAPKDQLLDLPV
ncbi:MAG: hypothetical protein Kow0042_22800 [Calditrichia bacterium]